jgi:hypothetical protein
MRRVVAAIAAILWAAAVSALTARTVQAHPAPEPGQKCWTVTYGDHALNPKGSKIARVWETVSWCEDGSVKCDGGGDADGPWTVQSQQVCGFLDGGKAATLTAENKGQTATVTIVIIASLSGSTPSCQRITVIPTFKAPPCTPHG